VGIEKGVAWSLHDVLESLLVLSANDAAYALAQRISGSLAAFAAVHATIGETDRDDRFHPSSTTLPAWTGPRGSRAATW